MAQSQQKEERVVIPDATIRQRARLVDFPGIVWKQWRAEQGYLAQGVDFRGTNSNEVNAAYSAMDEAGFNGINARQEWSNWRVLARSLNGRVPNRPLRVVDFGCGPGTSTKILAHYLPKGSEFFAFDISPVLISKAQSRSYRQADGSPARVHFRVLAAGESLKQPSGELMLAASIDYFNTAGVVGHHLDSTKLAVLAAEIKRVLKPGGLAALDFGPVMTGDEVAEVMEKAGFAPEGRTYAVTFYRRVGQAIFRKR